MKNFLSKVLTLIGLNYINSIYIVCGSNIKATLLMVLRMFYIKHYPNSLCTNQICLFTGFTKKYIWYFISIIIFITLVFTINSIYLLQAYNTHVSQQVDVIYDLHYRNTSKNYNLEHICKVAGCTSIYDTNGLAFSTYVIPERTSIDLKEFIKINNTTYLSSQEVLLYIEQHDLYISVSYQRYSRVLIYNYLIILTSLLVFVSIILYKTYKRERSEALLQQVGTEAILSNKSMVMITENVHHELNTPIEIIDNKVEKIHKIITDYLISENEWWMDNANLRVISEEKRQYNKKMVKLEKDFEFIKTAIEQIFSVLNKMKNFKSLRYSNGDKTIYDIIDGAFKIIGISNTDFTYEIDYKFKNYRMSSATFKNIDLINVLINHIKNSLEANSDKILVNIGDIKENMITILLTDNGTGIPPELMSNIFEPNLSSKTIGSTIRGNGMYLNKHIIRDSGGDIKIFNTSKNGTTVAVSIPVKYVEYEESYL